MEMSEEPLNTAWYSVPLYRDAIAAAIQKNYDGMCLSKDAARDVLAEFGPERVSHVLAATILDKLHDQRISDANMARARSVPMFGSGSRHYDYAINSHSVKLDGFVTLAQKELAAQEPQKRSVKEQLAAKPVSGGRPRDKPRNRGTRQRGDSDEFV
mgnify:CR=1 FL=1|jgi:hypothetical protein